MAKATAAQRSLHYALRDIADDQGTASSSILASAAPAATRTAAALLTEDAGKIRNRAKTLTLDAGENHQLSYRNEWLVLAQQRGAQSPINLLNELEDMGFAWRDIARLVGVSVPAVQKWRKGERLSPESRRKISSLMAACDFIAGHFFIEDIPTWFEMRIVDGIPITPIDLWSGGHQILFFEYAMRHLSPEEALNKFDSEWRERYRTDFETFRDDDGQIGIRMRDR